MDRLNDLRSGLLYCAHARTSNERICSFSVFARARLHALFLSFSVFFITIFVGLFYVCFCFLGGGGSLFEDLHIFLLIFSYLIQKTTTYYRVGKHSKCNHWALLINSWGLIPSTNSFNINLADIRNSAQEPPTAHKTAPEAWNNNLKLDDAVNKP